jgi:hypothetical protein
MQKLEGKEISQVSVKSLLVTLLQKVCTPLVDITVEVLCYLCDSLTNDSL